MRPTTIFFDLDGTLYPESSGLWKAIKERINRYLLERMGFPADEAAVVRDRFLQKYGTTLRGLQEEYQIDTDDYLAFVHDLPLNEYLAPDPALAILLQQVSLPMWIFTNSDRQHAKRVLTILGLGDLFSGIIDIHRLEFVCKPDPSAYLKALAIAGCAEASHCLFVDDSLANVQAAHRLGFQTVLVAEHPVTAGNPFSGNGSKTITSVHQLPDLLPGLLDRKPERSSSRGR